MKLSGDEIAPSDDTTQGNTVRGLTSNQRFILRVGVIAVNEVKIGVVRYTGEYGMGNRLFYLVPPHVRDFQPRRKPTHLSRKNAQALMPAILFCRSKQGL